MIVTLPSGLKGEVRRFKAADIQALADKLSGKLELGDGMMNPLISGAWVRTIESPYAWVTAGDTKPDFNRVLKGDLISALLQTRMHSFRDGNDYDFGVKCASCGEEYEWTIQLDSFIEGHTQALPESSKAHLQSGEALTCELYDGRTVSFQLLTLEREVDVSKLRRQQIKRGEREAKGETAVDRVTAAVVSVDGDNWGNNHAKRWKWVADLDLDDFQDLLDSIDEADCGLDTAVETRCIMCNYEQSVDLPLDKTFLRPKRRSKLNDRDAGKNKSPQAVTS